jgi:TM2 domain-containing membrane protein YozV
MGTMFTSIGGRVTYCSNCGNLVKEGARFCNRCGAVLSGGSPPYYGQRASVTSTWYPERKDPLIAVILSFLMPGVGQMYVGRMARGLIVLLCLSLLGLAAFMPGLFLITDGTVFSWMWWSVMAVIAYVVMYAAQLADAYLCAERHNRQGAPPRRY